MKTLMTKALVAVWASVGAVAAVAALHAPEQPETMIVAKTAPIESLAEKAKRMFFEALNRRPESRPEALAALWEAAAAEPGNGKLNLWLGLCHLWITAESAAGSRESVEHAILAEHHLAIARRLLPEDDRIVSWLAPVRIRLGKRSGDEAAVESAWDELRAAVKNDPCFHAVAMGLLRFEEPRGSAEFKEGLEALRAAAACGGDDPSVQNRKRWPHSLEGFALVLAQYELKVGNRQQAETMLMFAQERPSYAEWPHRGLMEGAFDGLTDAAARYANEDPKDDPPLVIGPGSAVSCRVCHEGR